MGDRMDGRLECGMDGWGIEDRGSCVGWSRRRDKGKKKEESKGRQRARDCRADFGEKKFLGLGEILIIGNPES